MPVPRRELNIQLWSNMGTRGVCGSLLGITFVSFLGLEPHQAQKTPGYNPAAGEHGGRAEGQVAGEGG